jgi:hypothetical protein
MLSVVHKLNLMLQDSDYDSYQREQYLMDMVGILRACGLVLTYMPHFILNLRLGGCASRWADELRQSNLSIKLLFCIPLFFFFFFFFFSD